MTKKQQNCKHENVVGTETYGVYGHYEPSEKEGELGTLYLKQGDGGLNDDLQCEDCLLKFNNGESDCLVSELEFV